MPKLKLERIMTNILGYKMKEELEQITGIRRTKDNKKYISSSLLIQYLDEKIKNKRYMQNNQYKQLLAFYDKNGLPKVTIDLLKIPLVYDFKEFYFMQVNYRSKKEETKIVRGELRNLSQEELKRIINNIRTLITLTKAKMSKIEDRINKNEDSTTKVIDNMRNYYDFAIRLTNIINELLILYPKIIYPSTKDNLFFRNAVDSINANINLINNNRLVIKRISNGSNILKLGRR